MLRTSSSPTHMDITGMVSALRFALRYSRKKATNESPTTTLNTASASAERILLTMVEKSVLPSGV